MEKIFHRCRCTKETFTEAGWMRWLKNNNQAKPVFTFGEFGYSINDICLTPRKPVEWHNRYCRITITTAQSPCGRWDYGYYWEVDGEGNFGSPLFIEDDSLSSGYSSEKGAICGCLKYLRKRFDDEMKWREGWGDDYDEFGQFIDNTEIIPYIEKALVQIDAMMERFDPRQLDLFD